jgi:hypothetical protein
MISITDKQLEDMAKRWPDLFQKSQIDYFEVGYGWYAIIETLCEMLSRNVTRIRDKISYLSIDLSPGNLERIRVYEEELAEAIEELPQIMQVKEKFGGLRFYAFHAEGVNRSYINFAETLSMRTCEWCGAPGEARSDGWTKVLCEKHHKERENPNIVFSLTTDDDE